MELNSIKPAEGAKHAKRRVGRGIGSGLGKTAGRGHKGQKSRSGGYHKVGFEGGQMPLQRRLPKFGFKPLSRTVYRAINLDDLQEIATAKNLTKIGRQELIEAGRISRKHLVKVLAKGVLTTALTVEANAFSKTAQEAIEKAGGSVIKL